jgi:transglutaminase-like putative cysteine protease
MIYEIYHETSFEYGGIVTFSHNIARLKPKNTSTQKLLEYRLEVSPHPSEESEFVDFFENTNTFISFKEPHNSLVLKAFSTVQRDETQIQKEIESYSHSTITYEESKERLKSLQLEDNCPKLYLFHTDLIPMANDNIVAYTKESFLENRPLFACVYEFMGRIFEDFDFESGFSDVTTPIDIIFKEKKGVCQDFAQFAISALRTIGIPTRYVSGYIRTFPAEGKEKLFGTDASHAWFSVYVPDIGWVDFDPTNNKIPNEEYIILGKGRDYHDIAPLKGVVQSSGFSKLGVKVDVKVVESTTS